MEKQTRRFLWRGCTAFSFTADPASWSQCSGECGSFSIVTRSCLTPSPRRSEDIIFSGCWDERKHFPDGRPLCTVKGHHMVVDTPARRKHSFSVRLLRKRHIFLRSAQRSDRKVPNGSAPKHFFSDTNSHRGVYPFRTIAICRRRSQDSGALMMNDYSYILAAATVSAVYRLWPHSRPLARIGWTSFLYDRKAA